MKKFITLLLLLLCSCATQNFDFESLNLDSSTKFESDTELEKYVEDEEPILHIDSVRKEVAEKKIIHLD